MCDNCSKIFPFDDQQPCETCACVMCKECIEANGERTCDFCLTEVGSDLESEVEI